MSWNDIYRIGNEFAAKGGEPAGYPRLIPGHALMVEPTHAFARNTGSTRVSIDEPEPTDADADGYRIVNQWWCEARAVTVNVVERPDGKRQRCTVPDQSWPLRLFRQMLPALGVANYFHHGAERRAVETLRGMVTDVQFNQYELTGTFVESSPRSRVVYLFRKGRPTIALGTGDPDHVRFLTALCLHPLGYYEQTGMGAMVPTDDVIAHLLMMRGAEPLLWRKANHHPAHSAAAMI